MRVDAVRVGAGCVGCVTGALEGFDRPLWDGRHGEGLFCRCWCGDRESEAEGKEWEGEEEVATVHGNVNALVTESFEA